MAPLSFPRRREPSELVVMLEATGSPTRAFGDDKCILIFNKTASFPRRRELSDLVVMRETTGFPTIAFGGVGVNQISCKFLIQ